jgi:RNA polymerase sigma-70 factor, ECF subfamily
MQSCDMDSGGDERLVLEARKGDIDAFSALIERYRARALRLAYGIAGDEAEDAVQEAFVKAFRNLVTFRSDAAFRPWLFTIVANEARNRRRSRARRTRIELRVAARPEPIGAGTDDLAIQSERRQRLVDAVAELPERYREVVALRYFAELAENETAAVLSCPLGTAKSRLSRALDLLRVSLGEEVTQ